MEVTNNLFFTFLIFLTYCDDRPEDFPTKCPKCESMIVHKVLKTGEVYECIEKKCKFKEPVPTDKLKGRPQGEEKKEDEPKD